MNKKYNSALFTLFVAGLFSLFTTNVFAQTTDSPKTEQNTKTCSGEKFVMPSSIAVSGEAFTTFIKVMSLPSGERQKAFSDLPKEGKANVFKVGLAMNFITRPNLTKEQKDLILESLSLISADTYDKTNPEKAAEAMQLAQDTFNKALNIFPQNEAHQIFADMNGDKKTVLTLLQKYEDLLKRGMMARRKIAKEMPVNDRVNIWKVQLAYHLATGKFSKAQNEFILEWLTALSPETFAPRTNLTAEEEAKALEALESRIFSVFTKPEGYAIFMTIGIQKFVADDEPSQSELAPPCSCRWYCDEFGYSCQAKLCYRNNLCGPFESWECTSVCQRSN